MTTIFDLAVGRTLIELLGANFYDAARYERDIYAAATAYWKNGVKGNFTSAMNVTIKFGLKSAFEVGAESVDVSADEFTPDDRAVIDAIIAEEKSHVSGLLEFLDGLAQDPTKNLGMADGRLRMWVNRYEDVVSRARVHFGGKARLQWKLGEAEHCTTCLALNGIVAWALEWDEAGIKPKSPDLECKGYNCACTLEPTDRRRSPKAKQRILAAIGG